MTEQSPRPKDNARVDCRSHARWSVAAHQLGHLLGGPVRLTQRILRHPTQRGHLTAP
jgi:hypothetical protein